MKDGSVAAVAAVIFLGGCANPHLQDNVASTSQTTEVPLGSLIAKKSGVGSNASSKVDLQALENERTMNNNGMASQQR